MELKEVKTGMFVSWTENKKNITALVSNVFFDKDNFEFTCAAIVTKHVATEEERKHPLFEFQTETRLMAYEITHRGDEWPGCENLFIMKNENFESANDKLKSLRYATFEEVNTLVRFFGFSSFVYKPLVFKWSNDERSLVCVEDVTCLEEKPDGIACVNGAFYAVNTDSYIKNGVVKYQ